MFWKIGFTKVTIPKKKKLKIVKILLVERDAKMRFTFREMDVNFKIFILLLRFLVGPSSFFN